MKMPAKINDLLAKPYVLLVATSVVIVSLFVYMWIDSNRLERSLIPKPKPAPPEAGKTAAVQAENTAPVRNEPEPAVQELLQSRVEPAAGWSDRPESYETARGDRQPFRRDVQNAGRTYDHIFQKGENVEGEAQVPVSITDSENAPSL